MVLLVWAFQLCHAKLAKLLGPVWALQPCRATAGLGASAPPCKVSKATWGRHGRCSSAVQLLVWALQLCHARLAKLLGPVWALQPCRATAGLGASALPCKVSKATWGRHGRCSSAVQLLVWALQLCHAKLAKLYLGPAWALQLCRAIAGLGASALPCKASKALLGPVWARQLCRATWFGRFSSAMQS